MRSQQETNIINRVLKAWGFGSLDEPGTIQALARIVQDHEHFGEILRACEPALRREMYDAMSPNLAFPARPLESYIIRAKEHAASMEFPTIDDNGNLHPYTMPTIGSWPPPPLPQFELFAQCGGCQKEQFFYGERKVDAIAVLRREGWAWDEVTCQAYRCPKCLGRDDALDTQAS